MPKLNAEDVLSRKMQVINLLKKDPNTSHAQANEMMKKRWRFGMAYDTFSSIRAEFKKNAEKNSQLPLPINLRKIDFDSATPLEADVILESFKSGFIDNVMFKREHGAIFAHVEVTPPVVTKKVKIK